VQVGDAHATCSCASSPSLGFRVQGLGFSFRLFPGCRVPVPAEPAQLVMYA